MKVTITAKIRQIDRSLTGRVCISLEVFVQYFERLWSERCSTFAFLGRFAADEVCQVLHAVLVSFLSLGHPSLQHRLDLLRTLRCYIKLLKPDTRDFAMIIRLSARAFQFAKNNFDSNRFVRLDSPTHGRNPRRWEEGQPGWGLGAVYGVLPRKIWVPHCPVPAPTSPR